MKRKLISTSLVFCLLALNMGCRHTQSTNPAVVTAVHLNDAAKACQTVATGLIDADKTLEALQASEPDYYAKVKPLLQRIAKANDLAIVAVSAALAGDVKADWRGAMLAVAQAASTSDLTVFGFKNPKSQQLVQVGFAALISILAVIPQSFGGKP